MEATYRLKPSELDADFIKLVKKVFKNREVEITITNASKKNDAAFINAVEDVRLRKNLVSFSPDEFEAFAEKLSSK
jgi:hypothetical protein